MHPEVERLRDRARRARRAQRGDRLVVCDIPLLFERKMTDQFDRIVLVDAPRPVRLERLVRERGLSETEAMDMIAAQMPAELKRARADFVIDNVGTLRELERAREPRCGSALAARGSTTPRRALARRRALLDTALGRRIDFALAYHPSHAGARRVRRSRRTCSIPRTTST